MKFTDSGGRVEMFCSADAEHVRLSVRDTGIGIPADKLHVIFDPFVQVRGDLARRHEGTGLGLAISRDLARGMGGDLTVESTLARGEHVHARASARVADGGLAHPPFGGEGAEEVRERRQQDHRARRERTHAAARA